MGYDTFLKYDRWVDVFQRKTLYPPVLKVHFNPEDGYSMSLQKDGTHLAENSTVS